MTFRGVINYRNQEQIEDFQNFDFDILNNEINLNIPETSEDNAQNAEPDNLEDFPEINQPILEDNPVDPEAPQNENQIEMQQNNAGKENYNGQEFAGILVVNQRPNKNNIHPFEVSIVFSVDVATGSVDHQVIGSCVDISFLKKIDNSLYFKFST